MYIFNIGKEQFVKEKLALALYQHLDEEIIMDLDDYTHDFFEILSAINNLGIFLNGKMNLKKDPHKN